MFNSIQPLVNLTNANLKAFSRFMKATELSDLTTTNAKQYGEVLGQSLIKISQSDAFKQWARDSFENLSSFTNECMENSFAMMQQAPALFAPQFENMTGNAEQAASSALRAVKRASASARQATDTEAARQKVSHTGKDKYRQLDV